MKLFPGNVQEIQRQIATIELEERIPTDSVDEREQLIELIANAKHVDPVLKQVAEESVMALDQRHTFRHNIVEDGGRAVFGDQYAKGEVRVSMSAGHDFVGNKVRGRGTRGAFGDRYGMPDALDGPESEDDQESDDLGESARSRKAKRRRGL